MRIFENELYQKEIQNIAELDIPWNKLAGKSILISGASGLIASCLIDVLMYCNQTFRMKCMIYALGRNEKRAMNRFEYCWQSSEFHFIPCDINQIDTLQKIDRLDYVLHLASNTHPIAYSTDPIGTIATNIIGTQKMLDLAVRYKAERFLFASSNEIYGENRGDEEKFGESYCGYIDCNTLRAGYPESKRCGEALCQAYSRQLGIETVITRFTRTYGPTMLSTDTKAISQFILNAVQDKNIILKSAGNQYYSYSYVADAVSGLLTVLLCGQCGEAYNIADERSDILLKDLARMIAEQVGRTVIFEQPNTVESMGYSKATKARLDGSKLMNLGWRAKYDIQTGVERTIKILKQIDF